MENIKEILFDPLMNAAWEIHHNPRPYVGFLITILFLVIFPYLGVKICEEQQKFIKERELMFKRWTRREKRRMTRTRVLYAIILLTLIIPAGTVRAEDSLRYVKPGTVTVAEKNLETAGRAILEEDDMYIFLEDTETKRVRSFRKDIMAGDTMYYAKMLTKQEVCYSCQKYDSNLSFARCIFWEVQ